jgi:hypothetical protein
MSPQVSRVALAAALAALAAAAGAAPDRRVRPSGPGEDCLACHDALVAGMKVVHPPVQRGLCVACHLPASAWCSVQGRATAKCPPT